MLLTLPVLVSLLSSLAAPIPNNILEYGLIGSPNVDRNRIGDPERVTLETPTGKSFTAYHYKNDLISSEINYSIEWLASLYPDALLLDNPTVMYNCHSYAWYDASSNNQYWIESPSVFYLDSSLVTASTGNPGDIVVYKDSQGNPIHSGIIDYRIKEYDGNWFDDQYDVKLKDLGNVVINSKRGYHGLYSHIGNECPYKTATYIEYYSFIEHTHDYSFKYETNNDKTHYAYCSCGKKIIQGHIVAPGAFENGNRYATCLECGGLASMGFVASGKSNEANTFIEVDGDYFVTKTKQIDGVLNLSYEDYINYKEVKYE